MLNREEILQLFDDIKCLLKNCDCVMVNGDKAVGIENKYIYKETNLSLNIQYVFYIKKTSEIMNIYKIESTDDVFIDFNNLILHFEFNCVDFQINLNLSDYNYYNLYNISYPRIKQMTNFSTIQINNLEQDAEFSRLMSLKTGDGSSLYKINNYILSIYKGLLPVNKGNIVNLKITEQTNYFIANFSIIKPKNKYINIILTYLRL